jgi:acyl-ACP thioesterase
LSGRRFVHVRRVRLSECDPAGRVRLDALACWLQDVAADDVADTDLTEADGLWILRRVRLEVARWPRYQEDCEVETWASGHGGSVAERRTTIAAGAVAGTALWAAVDPTTQRPQRLTERFFASYGEAIAGRRVSSKLGHGDPPDGAVSRDWPVRYADLDRVGHVNNAAYFEAVEDLCGTTPPRLVEVEYRGGLTREGPVTLLISDGALWFEQGGRVAASATYR